MHAILYVSGSRARAYDLIDHLMSGDLVDRPAIAESLPIDHDGVPGGDTWHPGFPPIEVEA